MTKTLYAEFTVKPGHEARVAEMTATLTTHVRNEPGNLLFNAYTRARGCGVHRARRRANRITREAQALRPSGRVRQRRPDHRHRKGQVAREGGFAPTTRRDRHRRPTVTTMRLWPFGSRRPRSQRRNQPSEPARCPRCAAHRRRTRPPPNPPPPRPTTETAAAGAAAPTPAAATAAPGVEHRVQHDPAEHRPGEAAPALAAAGAAATEPADVLLGQVRRLPGPARRPVGPRPTGPPLRRRLRRH